MNLTIKMKMKLLLLALAALAAINSYGQNRGVAYVDTLAVLDAMRPQPGMTVYVRGATNANDWGDRPLPFTYSSTSSNATDRFCRATATGVGRYIHDWNGDVRAFGVTSEFPALATEIATNQMDSRAMIQSAIDLMSERGGGIVRLPPGRVRIGGSLYMKPRVHLQGTVAPMGFTSPRSLASGQTSRLLAGTTLEMASANGIGEACLIFDGPRYFTNMFTQQFVNFDGDTVYYRSGANSVQNIGFVSYNWGWGSTNPWPVAAIVIRDVDGVLVKNCGFENVAGHGIWTQGARGLVVEACAAANTLLPTLFCAYTSDTRIINNDFGTGQLIFYRANTHVVQNNGIWNPRFSLVTSTTTMSVTNYGTVRPYIVDHTHYTSSATDEIINSTLTFAADTGTMLVFRGSNAPSPFVINKPYFAINGTNGSRIKLASSPLNALNGVAIDITADATNGNWKLTGYNEAVVVYECEEIMLQNNRMDQSYQDAISIVGGVRCVVDGNTIWEVGANQQPSRFNAFTGDTTWSGVDIVDSSGVSVTGNLITGGYNFSSSANTAQGDYRGVSVTNSYGVSVSGNTFNLLKYGVYADAKSRNVRSLGNLSGGSVARMADSGNTNGINSIEWDGIKLNGTNPVVSTAFVSGKTNLSDFCLRMLVQPGTAQVGFSGDQYHPLFNVSSSTNYTSWGQATTNSIRGTFYKANGTTNWFLIVDIVGSQTEWRRSSLGGFDEMFALGTPIDLVVQRTNGVWQSMRNGISAGLGFGSTGANPPNQSNALHVVYATLGTWPLNLWMDGIVHEFSLHDRSYAYTDLRDGKHLIPNTNAVVVWDFRNDTGSTVMDKSGNGVNATVISLDGTTAHSFGVKTP